MILAWMNRNAIISLFQRLQIITRLLKYCYVSVFNIFDKVDIFDIYILYLIKGTVFWTHCIFTHAHLFGNIFFRLYCRISLTFVVCQTEESINIYSPEQGLFQRLICGMENLWAIMLIRWDVLQPLFVPLDFSQIIHYSLFLYTYIDILLDLNRIHWCSYIIENRLFRMI